MRLASTSLSRVSMAWVTDVRLVGAIEQAVFEHAVRRLVNDLHRSFGNRHNRYHAANDGRLKAGEGKASGDVFEADHVILTCHLALHFLPVSSAALPARTHSSTSVALNFQSRPTLWAGRRFRSIHL